MQCRVVWYVHIGSQGSHPKGTPTFVFRETPDPLSVAGATLVLATTVGMAILRHLTAKQLEKVETKDGLEQT